MATKSTSTSPILNPILNFYDPKFDVRALYRIPSGSEFMCMMKIIEHGKALRDICDSKHSTEYEVLVQWLNAHGNRLAVGLRFELNQIKQRFILNMLACCLFYIYVQLNVY